MSSPELEESCSCDASVRRYCHTCKGTGLKLTAFGDALLELVVKHLYDYNGLRLSRYESFE